MHQLVYYNVLEVLDEEYKQWTFPYYDCGVFCGLSISLIGVVSIAMPVHQYPHHEAHLMQQRYRQSTSHCTTRCRGATVAAETVNSDRGY